MGRYLKRNIFQKVGDVYVDVKYLIWRCRRIVSWIPVLWRSVDNDYSDAIEVFEYQLTRMADRMESGRAYSTRAKQDGRRLRMVLRLMRKVYNDEYAMAYMDEMEKLYGKQELGFKKIEDLRHTYTDEQWELIGNKEGLSEMVTEYEKDYTPEEIEKIEAHEDELRKIADAKQKRAHILLWKLVEHNIPYWWD